MKNQTQSPAAASDGWKVCRTIGHGATAIVSLAAASNTGHFFAVKSAHVSRSSLLRREQNILSSLASPYVISCLGFDVSGGSYHLFLEFAAGGAISDFAGHLDESKIGSFARQILLGLSYLHSKGIAHCDVKGRNVLLCSDGRIKLADFGCARSVNDCSRFVMGTPAFMAPEVVKGAEQGISGDVWSLGCTVVEMATGKSPWPEAADPAEAIHKIAFSSEVPAMPEWISDKGKDFVSKCLQRDPKERWTAEQLLRHPFIADAEDSWQSSKGISPKSIMEFELWNSETEDEEEEEEEASPTVNFAEEIRQLESSPANWAWDESWIAVRAGSGENEGTPKSEFTNRISSFGCSGSGRDFAGDSKRCKDADLWSESIDREAKECYHFTFACEGDDDRNHRTETEIKKCNCFANNMNALHFCYLFVILIFFQLTNRDAPKNMKSLIAGHRFLPLSAAPLPPPFLCRCLKQN